MSKLRTQSLHMRYNLNSLKGVIKGLYRGLLQRVTKGDARSLDNGSYEDHEAYIRFLEGWANAPRQGAEEARTSLQPQKTLNLKH